MNQCSHYCLPDIKHYGLEQCNGRAALATESCNDSRGMGLSFQRDAYGIDWMVDEKMVTSDFGGAAGPRLQTLGVGANKP